MTSSDAIVCFEIVCFVGLEGLSHYKPIYRVFVVDRRGIVSLFWVRLCHLFCVFSEGGVSGEEVFWNLRTVYFFFSGEGSITVMV